MGGIEGIWLTMPLSEELMVTDYDPNLTTHIHFLDENQDNNLHDGMTAKDLRNVFHVLP